MPTTCRYVYVPQQTEKEKDTVGTRDGLLLCGPRCPPRRTRRLFSENPREGRAKNRTGCCRRVWRRQSLQTYYQGMVWRGCLASAGLSGEGGEATGPSRGCRAAQTPRCTDGTADMMCGPVWHDDRSQCVAHGDGPQSHPAAPRHPARSPCVSDVTAQPWLARADTPLPDPPPWPTAPPSDSEYDRPTARRYKQSRSVARPLRLTCSRCQP